MPNFYLLNYNDYNVEVKDMSKTDFMSLYEELSVLNESKADIDNFITKFGQDTYD